MKIKNYIISILSCLSFNFAPGQGSMSIDQYFKSVVSPNFEVQMKALDQIQLVYTISDSIKTEKKPCSKINPLYDVDFMQLIRSFLKFDEIRELLPVDRATLEQNLPTYKRYLEQAVMSSVMISPFISSQNNIGYEVSFGNSRYCLFYSLAQKNEILLNTVSEAISYESRTVELCYKKFSNFRYATEYSIYIEGDQCIFEWQKKYGGEFVIKILDDTHCHYITLNNFKTIPGYKKDKLYDELYSFTEYVKTLIALSTNNVISVIFALYVNNAVIDKLSWSKVPIPLQSP